MSNSWLKKFAIPKFPIQVKLLIFCAFTKAIAYWALNSYMSIYLMKLLGINVEEIGLLIGIGSLGGIMTAAIFGFLVDRINKFRLLNGCLIVLALFAIVLPLCRSIIIILFALIILDIASTGLSTIYSTWFSILLEEEECKKAFSIKYILENIGAMIGPVLGIFMVVYNDKSPFYISAIFIIVTILIMLFNRRIFSDNVSTVQFKNCDQKLLKEEFITTFHCLISDKRLIYFTLGGIFSMMVYGALVPFLSQYFLVIYDYSTAYNKVAYVSAINAAIVMIFQYFFTALIKKEHILKWINTAILCLIVGLLIIAGNSNVFMLTIAIVFMSFGELIIVPAEYLFILEISSENLRGSYFGAQNLIYLGITLSPMLCGLLLNRTSIPFTFGMLIVVLMLSSMCYSIGYLANKKIELRR